jgi:hypothetical protein
MPKEFLRVEGVNEWIRAFETAGRKAEADMEEALKEGAEALAGAVKRRVFPARKINKQDSRTARTLSRNKPVYVRVGGTRAEVELRPYYGRARSGPVGNVMRRVGQGNKLVRTSLQVAPNGSALRRVSFRKAPRLLRWAQQGTPPNDWQYHRHTVRLSAEALLKLSMDPAIGEASPKIDAAMDKVQRLFVRKVAQ